MTEFPVNSDDQNGHIERLVVALKAFYAAWRAAAVYDENNQSYQSRRKELAAALAEVFHDAGELRIDYQNDYFFLNGERVNLARIAVIGRTLARRLTELKVGNITIAADATSEALDHAIFALAQADTRCDDPFAALTDTWAKLGLAGITIDVLAERSDGIVVDDSLDEADREKRRRRRAQALLGRVENVVQDFWTRIRDRNSFEASPVQRVVHQMIDVVAHDEDILLEFAALKDFDEYTYYHSVNVAIYSIAVGLRLGLDRPRLASLGVAALMHDIGKVRLPHDLISKPEEFDDEDWKQIRQHPALGALTIASLRRVDEETATAMAAAFEHHLKMDLSGYPPVTAQRELHLYSRIVAVCDAYDAMTAGRVYQKTPIAPEEAVRRLLYSGSAWYDPLILKAFVHVVGVFPVGTLTRMSDGSIGIVIRNGKHDLYCPEVLIIRKPDGTDAREEVRLEHKRPAGEVAALEIAAVLEPEKEGINIFNYIGKIQDDDLVYELTPAMGTPVPPRPRK